MDAVSDPLIEEIVVMKSAQVGWTALIGNIVGFYVDQDPAPLLVVQPSLEMAEAWSKDRLAPMIRDTPCLTRKISDAKSRDSGNTILHKRFAGGHVTIVGANSPSGLASRPIRVVLADEIDRYDASAGSEGDPLSLAYKRTTTFWNRKRLAGSTPTIAGVSRIEAAFEQSDKRRFFVPCPGCGEMQVLHWQQVKWDKGSAGQHRPETAYYLCEAEGCGSAWTDAERWNAVSCGEWRATGGFNGVAGFHIWEAYSPWVTLTDTVKAFLAAKGNPETLKTWTNTALGETWAEKGEAPDWQRLYDRREMGLKLGTVPAWAGILVGSVDVQRGGGGRLELDVWAFGPGKQRALVDHLEVDGAIADAVTWADLDEKVGRHWKSADGRTLKLARVAIDTGDGENTMHAYAWARRHTGFAMAIKGRETVAAGMPIAGPTWMDLTIAGRKIKRGVRLWTVGTSMLKQELYGQLGLEKPIDGGGYPDGYVHLPDGATDEWIKQLVGEQFVRVRLRSGGVRMEWRQLRPRNEALDNAIYARAAAIALGVDRWSERDWARARGEMDVPALAPPAASEPLEKTKQAARPSTYLDKRRTTNWLNRRR